MIVLRVVIYDADIIHDMTCTFSGPGVLIPKIPSKNVAVATSNDAEDDKPPPRGTLPHTAISNPGILCPAT